MDDSTNTLLYTATYVFIFIIALSLSIVLYFSINKYADSAFEYSQGLNGSIINTGSTGLEEYDAGEVPLTRSDVFSYYVNYVKKDLYGSDKNGNQDIEYVVNILDPTTSTVWLPNNLTYEELQKKLLTKEKYYLEYENETTSESGKKIVSINIYPA